MIYVIFVLIALLAVSAVWAICPAYAQMISIDFIKWTAREGWEIYDDEDRWIQPAESSKVITAKELYDLYKNISFT